MALPGSRDITFVAGTSQIPAATMNNLQDYLVALFKQYFGDGSDGTKTVAGTETLTKDVFYTTLTVPFGTALNTGGFKIRCSQSVALAGSIQHNGSGITGAVGKSLGKGADGGTAGAAGVDGGNAEKLHSIDSASEDIYSWISLGGVAGSGGNGGGKFGGAVSLQNLWTTNHGYIDALDFLRGGMNTGAGSASARDAGPKLFVGGGGGGGGANDGGYGGGGGGLVVVSAPSIVVTGTGGFSAQGYNGYFGVGADGGGGGGGAGGAIVLIYRSISVPTTIAAACYVNGASGGASGGGTGQVGTAGGAGQIFTRVI